MIWQVRQKRPVVAQLAALRWVQRMVRQRHEASGETAGTPRAKPSAQYWEGFARAWFASLLSGVPMSTLVNENGYVLSNLDPVRGTIEQIVDSDA